MARDGTGQSLLISANSTGFSNHIPAWSPDGTEIATLHFPSGSFTGPYSLWVMNADGTGGVALADGLSSAYSNPGWSSDGSWLAFTRNDQVWRIQRDGTQLTQVTTGGGWEPSIGTRTLNIPGNVISFTRPEPASGEETNIWIMDADGSNQT